jgi:hypothetical protein
MLDVKLLKAFVLIGDIGVIWIIFSLLSTILPPAE